MHRTILLLAVCSLLLPGMNAIGPITVGETRIENNFPQAVTFSVEAISSAGTVTAVELHTRTRGDSTTTIQVAEFDPAARVTVSVAWHERPDGTPPGTELEYSWLVRDSAGNSYETDPVTYLTVDSRFNWRTLEDDSIKLWWYEGGQSFGQNVFDTATRALRQMEETTGQTLPHRLYIVLYPDFQSFAGYHDYIQDWVGGQAYTDAGLTVQIVPSASRDEWVAGVIPHEVAHLFFYQIVNNPLAPGPPNWLSEGFAQYYEFSSQAYNESIVRRAVADGQIIPLRLLTGSFNGDANRVSLMYAESWSAVEFLVERWGDGGLASLLQAYREGADNDEALQQVTGLDFEGFQRAWWEWLGGPADGYPTPFVWTGVTATPALPVPGRVPSETPTATPAPPAGRAIRIPGCSGAALPLVLMLIVWSLHRRSHPRGV